MKKIRFSYKKVAIFIAFQLFFMLLTSPLIIFFGPYTNIKKTIISTVLATRHKYLVTNIMSQETIDDILGPSVAASNIGQDISQVHITHKNSNKITRYDLHTSMFDGYLLEIEDPTKIKVALTKHLGAKGQKTSEMAKERNAIAAINGGSFVDKSSSGKQYAGTGATPGGFVIADGEVVFKDSDEDRKENVLAFTKEGNLVVGDHSINDLKALNVTEAMCFRPPTLIINGKRQISTKSEDGLNPRTAIGQKKDGTVLFLVIDGRKSLTKLGASLYDVQEILLKYGAINAGNLDGGYSSSMYYDGELINSPNEWDGERTVATAFYVEQ